MNRNIFYKAIGIDIFLLLLILLITYLSNFFFPEILIDLSGLSNYFVIIPSILLIVLIVVLTLGLLKYERIYISYKPICKRLRIKGISWKDFFQALLIYISLLILQSVFLLLFGELIVTGGIVNTTVDYSSFKIVNSTIIYIYPLVLIIGAITEEFFWRGYLLPLQEKRWGKYSWVVNGLFWTLSHILVLNPLTILFTGFGISYIGYRYKNTTLTIIVHVLNNALFAVKWITSY